jgi:hypothetical protein
MSNLSDAEFEALLADVSRRPQQRGNLIFALDATASRERTWDTAAKLQAQMFAEVAVIGSLDVQLIYFRGIDECKASTWVSDPMVLAKLMVKIRCEAGETQIERVLARASRETAQRKINAVVYVGDCCEESRDQLVPAARKLGDLGVPVFMFQEGPDQIAESRFKEIAELTHGAYYRFDRGSARQLAELLKAVAMFAVGGVMALERQGSEASKYLLGQIKS